MTPSLASSHSPPSPESSIAPSSEEMQRGSSSSSSNLSWREARTREWPVPVPRRRRYDSESDLPPSCSSSVVSEEGSKMNKEDFDQALVGEGSSSVRLLPPSKDLPGAAIVPVQPRQKGGRSINGVGIKKGKKEISSLPPAPPPSSSTRRRCKRERSLAALALLPLQYTVLILLHLGLWALTTSLRLVRRSKDWFTERHSHRDRSDLEEELLRIRRRDRDVRAHGAEARVGTMENGHEAAGLKVPGHLALAFPASPPATSHLLARLAKGLLSSILSFPSSGKSPSSSSRRQQRQRAYEDGEAARKISSLRNAVAYSALIGIAEVSVWDECGAISRWLGSGAQGEYDAESGVWKMIVSQRRMLAAVEVRDGRMRSQRGVGQARADPRSSIKGHSRREDSEVLHLVLNLLTPRWDGRASFAGLSTTIAEKLTQEVKADVTSGDQEQGREIRVNDRTDEAVARADYLEKRIEGIGVAEIDEELKRRGLPLTEPDLLMVSGGDATVCTLSDFPRWMIRVTEIFHAVPSALGSELSIFDFFAALEQFTNAEQRYGK